ncbi:MAG: acylphosphatase [Anaerolineaceae bacterium]
METPPDKIQRLHAIVEGHVQGVGFRYFALEQAQRLGLTGWVRNLPWGEVELEAEGSRQDLDTFLKKLYEGPAGCHVRHITWDWFTATGEDSAFRVRVYD